MLVRLQRGGENTGGIYGGDAFKIAAVDRALHFKLTTIILRLGVPVQAHIFAIGETPGEVEELGHEFAFVLLDGHIIKRNAGVTSIVVGYEDESEGYIGLAG